MQWGWWADDNEMGLMGMVDGDGATQCSADNGDGEPSYYDALLTMGMVSQTTVMLCWLMGMVDGDGATQCSADNGDGEPSYYDALLTMGMVSQATVMLCWAS